MGATIQIMDHASLHGNGIEFDFIVQTNFFERMIAAR